MPDYFTLLSFELKLPSADAVIHAIDTYELACAVARLRDDRDNDGHIPPNKLPDDLKDSHDLLDDLSWEFEVIPGKNSLWIHSEHGGVISISTFIQHLMRKFDILEPVGFEWASTCSKPAIDSFGGGAIAIWHNAIRVLNTSSWLHQLLTNHPGAPE